MEQQQNVGKQVTTDFDDRRDELIQAIHYAEFKRDRLARDIADLVDRTRMVTTFVAARCIEYRLAVEAVERAYDSFHKFTTATNS